MTEMKYTIEQIEAACYKAMPTLTTDSNLIECLKAELQRPAWEHGDGEVVYDIRYAHYTIIPDADSLCRPLNLREHGPAVEALRDFVARNDGVLAGARTALQAFDEVVENDNE